MVVVLQQQSSEHEVIYFFFLFTSLCSFPGFVLIRSRGELGKVSELISGLAPGPEEESPYEALFEATSCHSLDSVTSGKSSDRDSGRPDSEVGKVGSSLCCSHPHTCTRLRAFSKSGNADPPLEGDGCPLCKWQQKSLLHHCSLWYREAFWAVHTWLENVLLLCDWSFTERSHRPLITPWSWRGDELRGEVTNLKMLPSIPPGSHMQLF